MDGDQHAQQALVFPNGARIDYEPDPQGAQSTTPTLVVSNTYEAVYRAQTRIDAIKANNEFTPIAKAAKIEAIEDEAIVAIIKGRRDLDKMNASVTAAEAKVHAPTKIDPTDAVSWLADQERRAYLKSLSGPERTAVLSAVGRGEDEGMCLAIKRSPYKLAEDATRVADAAWADRCRTKDPAATQRFDMFRASHAWGDRVFAQMHGVVLTMTKADQRRFERIAKSLPAES